MTSPTSEVAASPLPLPSHVLVIEDDVDACANLRDILELDEFQVSTAGSIAEALDRMSHDPVEMIILDRRLPDGSAEEARPRRKAKAPGAAIIIITGYADLGGGDPVAGFTEMAVRELGSDRVLYGSDVGGRSFASQLAKVCGAQIPVAAKRQILVVNLHRLLSPTLQAQGVRV